MRVGRRPPDRYDAVGLAQPSLTDQIYANFDVKYLWINTDVEINGGAIEADVDLNPWIVGVGLGYRF